ncbi:SRPBCC family protein [Maribacter sp. 2-571]|uniref:SRPBCC family protein n=1 Tax=Maribacter sp. 2-571 TaxID=3417569 RepID=UPI003D32A47D
MKDHITLKRTYACTVDRLWRALTDPEAMSQWLMPCDIAPVIGHKFQFRTEPQRGFDGIVHCEVLEVLPKKRLVFSWCNGKLDTKVSFELKDKGDTVDLYFKHSGFSGIFERVFVRQILANGWRKKILTKNLVTYLRS